MKLEVDVIIIGAGAAGLSAAKELSKLGLSYRLIEGSHRIGGRAYSEELAPGAWFDLGCAWLVDGANNPFADIADNLGIDLVKDKSHFFTRNNLRFMHNGERLSEARRADCLAYYAENDKAIALAEEQGQDIAISDVIDFENDYFPPFLGEMGVAWGADPDQLSSKDHMSSTGELGFQVPNGYGNLVAAWAAGVDVSLNTRAEEIDWSGVGSHGVTVKTPKGTITGRTVLCTVSTGILTSGDIRFSPGLPDWKLEAIQNLPMGAENKMGLYFDKDVFGDEGRGYYNIWDDDGKMAKVDISVTGHNKVSVLVGGRQGDWLEKQGQQASRDFAIDRVADIFGNDIRKHVKHSIQTAWNTEPWTYGAWAHALPGQAFQREYLERPIDDRLFFAGEATMLGSQGTCHGAYLSGIRAAEKIAVQLNVGA